MAKARAVGDNSCSVQMSFTPKLHLNSVSEVLQHLSPLSFRNLKIWDQRCTQLTPGVPSLKISQKQEELSCCYLSD
jgi:hypothetical protein